LGLLNPENLVNSEPENLANSENPVNLVNLFFDDRRPASAHRHHDEYEQDEHREPADRHPDRICSQPQLDSRARLAAPKTASIMREVNLPVLVFCRLG